MKIQVSSALLCLLALANVGLAANVVVQEGYSTNDCSGNVTFNVFASVADKCQKGSGSPGTISYIYTCNPVSGKTFSNSDCSGDPTLSETYDGCQTISGSSGSSMVECQSIADNRLATITRGTGCGDDGTLTNGKDPRFTVIDECISAGSQRSFKLVVEDDDVLSLSAFETSPICEGDSTVNTIKVGECKKVPGIILASGNEEFVTVDPFVKGTKLGNNAIINSVNFLALVIAMAGALMTMA